MHKFTRPHHLLLHRVHSSHCPSFQLLYVNLHAIYLIQFKLKTTLLIFLLLEYYCYCCGTLFGFSYIDLNHSKNTVSESDSVHVLGEGGRGVLLSEWTTTYWCLALIDGPNRVVLLHPNRLKHILRMLDFNVAMDKVWLECCGNSIGDFTLKHCHKTYFESFTGEEWNLVHLLTW